MSQITRRTGTASANAVGPVQQTQTQSHLYAPRIPILVVRFAIPILDTLAQTRFPNHISWTDPVQAESPAFPVIEFALR